MRLAFIKFSIPLSVIISLILISCSGKSDRFFEKGVSEKNNSSKDSTKLADSSGQVVALQTEMQLTYEQRQGKQIYSKYCAVCHGIEGKGDGFNSFNLDPKPRDFSDTRYMNALSEERLFQTVDGGGRSVNKSPLMPTWGGRLSKEEIEFVAAYIHTFGKSY